MNARRRLLGSVLALGATAGLLTGCAAGQHAATSEETQVADANGAQAGDIALRGVSITAPSTYYQKGSNATIELIVVNTPASAASAGDDTLTGVSSPIASSAGVTTAGLGSLTLTSPAPISSTPLPIPQGASVSIGYPGDPQTVVLSGLTADLYSGQSFPVTFTFAKAGAITLNVAVKLNTSAQVSPSYITNLAPTGD